MKKRYSFVIILMYLTNLAFGQFLSNGWHSPSGTATITGIGVRSWLSTTNAITSDGVYATSTALVLGQTTNYLVLTGFNVSLPSNAIVSGISLNVQKTFAGLLGIITDSVVSLVKNGTITGANRASQDAWVYPEATSTYGSNKDLWGTTWAASDINASNFGIVISARLGGVLALTTAQVDMVQLQVFYSVPLPVTLTDFTASLQSDKTALSWVTEAEINNNYFLLERSTDGAIFFAIDTIMGNGNSTTEHNYIAEDPEPFTGTNYYRLKQVDMNGNYQYSTMVSVDNETESSLSAIQVYPNPVQVGAQLTIKGSNHNQQAELIDMLGQQYGSYKLGPESMLSIPIPSITSSFLILLLKDELTGALSEKKICVTGKAF